MVVSGAFSVTLYNSSTYELRNLERRQMVRFQDLPFVQPEISQLNVRHIQQIEDSLGRIKLGLLYFNLAILFSGGAASYFLARRTLQPIEEALEDQKRFTADASHELRTPLTAIKTELEVALRDNKLTLTDSKNLHRSTLEEIDKLEALATGLLTLAQQDNDTSPKSQRYELQTIITEATERLKKVATKRGITLITPTTKLSLETDGWALTELLTILLDNAIKYSDSNTMVSIVISLRHHKQQLAISIRDQGVGIAPAALPHIFDRFWRADQSRSKKQTTGYGLGLSIAKKISNRLRAEIVVVSKQAVGSEFTILLPYVNRQK